VKSIVALSCVALQCPDSTFYQQLMRAELVHVEEGACRSIHYLADYEGIL